MTISLNINSNPSGVLSTVNNNEDVNFFSGNIQTNTSSVSSNLRDANLRSNSSVVESNNTHDSENYSNSLEEKIISKYLRETPNSKSQTNESVTKEARKRRETNSKENTSNRSRDAKKIISDIIREQSNGTNDDPGKYQENTENIGSEIPSTETSGSSMNPDEELSNSPVITDEMIIRALSFKKKRQAENNSKTRKLLKLSSSVTESPHNKIFTERPFFHRLTESVYRRLIIGSSNQIKLVGLISAARLLVHLYETNALEIPKSENVQYNIPLLSCHVGDWQPMDSERMIISSSNLPREILGHTKTSHTPPLINRTRNIYIVTPLNYDGNKVGGGYRGGGSDPLSRLVMKWRNLSMSDVQDFSYVTENGFDLKYNGFYILYAKSNKPGSQWKQFYSARMRTSAFNNRHQILINSTHSSKLIKLHTVHLQKDGIDLPIGMALFEDHTESLSAEDFRRESSIQYPDNFNTLNDSNNLDKLSKNASKSQVNSKVTDEFVNSTGYNEIELNKINNTNSNLYKDSKIGNELPTSNMDLQNTPKQNNNNTANLNNSMNNNSTNNLIYESNSSNPQSQLSNPYFLSSFAKDSHELSLLLNFRSLSPKIQGDFLHAISCVKFLNQDLFSAILRSSLDTAYVSSGYADPNLNTNVNPNGNNFLQQYSFNLSNVDKSQIELPLFFKLSQDQNSEQLNINNNNIHYLQNQQFVGAINVSNEMNRNLMTQFNPIEAQNMAPVASIGNSLFPMFWPQIFAFQQTNNPNICKNPKIELDEINCTSEHVSNELEIQNSLKTPVSTTPNMKTSSSSEN